MKKQFWILILFLFCVISLLADVVNDKFHLVDFEVYYRTAVRMIEGGPIYRIDTDGHFVYKYAPTAALFFIPFTLISFEISQWLFWFLLALVLGKTLYLLYSLCQNNRHKKSINGVILAALLTVGTHVHLEWHLGQVNSILLLLYVLIIYAYHEDRPKTIAALLSASLFVKPFALIFLPYLLFKKRFSALYFSFIYTLVFAFLPLFFYPSYAQFLDLYNAWFNELNIEMSAKQNLFALRNHSIFSVIARSAYLNSILVGAAVQQAFQLSILGIMALSFLYYIKKGSYIVEAATGELALLCAWIPLIAFSSQNAYLFSLPLLIYLFTAFDELNIWFKTLLVAACILLGINIYELMGKASYQFLLDHSIYVYGSILLVAVAFKLRTQRAAVATQKMPIL